MAYTDYQVYFDISGPASSSVADLDAWMYDLFRNQIQVRGGWERQVVAPFIEYTTSSGMDPFTTGAYEQWRIVETNELNVNAPIVVVDDLRGTIIPINQAPYFIKSVIVTGSAGIAESHAGCMQAIATMHPDWVQGPTTIDGGGVYRTRWVMSDDDPVSNVTDFTAVPSAVLSGLLKRLHLDHSGVDMGGYIVTNKPRFGNGIDEHSNPGRISVFIYQQSTPQRVMVKLSTLAGFNSFLHPSDADSSVAATGSFFIPSSHMKGFINPHQLVCHMEAGDRDWIVAGCPKLVDIRKTPSELPIPVETAFFGSIPRNAGSGRGSSFYERLFSSGATLLHLNGTTRINDANDTNLLASPHCIYWHYAGPAGFASAPPIWAAGSLTPTGQTLGEIYEPWLAYNPFSSTAPGAYFAQLHDCILINDGRRDAVGNAGLIEGDEFTFDGRTFKVYSRDRQAVGAGGFATFAFRVGTEEDADPHP